MSTIEQAISEKVQALPPEKQQEVLKFVESLSPPQPGTIWEKLRQRASHVPDEVWDQVPADGAEQHDHYLYGAPKK
jgi:hypothetical protein